MKKPKIRFKGCSGEWKETTLGQLSTNYKYGINAAAIPYDGRNKYLRITDIDENTRVFSQDNLTSPGTDLSCCNEYLLEDGDITVARTGASVGKSYIYHPTDGKVYFAGFLIRARLNENVDKDCVFYNTLTDKYAKYIRLVSQRSGQPGVNVEELKGYIFNLPCDKAEQQSIASYFQHLDSLIQSTTKKIESLKQVKAASLQSMFPQEGETTPRVRFKGFEGEWEKVKLGDVLTYEQPSKYLVTNTEYEKSGVPVLTAGKTFVLGYTSDTFGLYTDLPVIIFDDFTTESKFVDFLFKAKSSAMKMLNTARDMDVDIKFVYETMKNIRYRVENHQRHWLSVFSKITIKIPSISEQRAIASYFTTLDRQISLQTQRLEKLKQIKAACLENMFV